MIYVGVDAEGGVEARYEDTSAETLIKHVPESMLHKVPDGTDSFQWPGGAPTLSDAKWFSLRVPRERGSCFVCL